MFEQSIKQIFLGLVGITYLASITGCAFDNTNRLSDNTNTSIQEVIEDNERSPTSPTSEVIETSEQPPLDSVNQSNRLYEKLVEQYGEDYKSCGESIQVEAKACDAEGTTGKPLEENLNIELVLDASGSMAGLVGGEEKLTVAKDVLTKFVSQLPSHANVALRVYGHIGSNQDRDKTRSCNGSELLYDFQPVDQDQFATTIKSFNPTGWTPIADSLKQAKIDFGSDNVGTNENVVYLVSDGIETCDGDPVAAAATLNQSEVKAIVNIIGFDVDAEASKQLRAVAQAGGGEYIEANTRNELYRIFNQNIISAYQKYSCTVSEQTSAYSQTVSAQTDRYKCIVNKATKEYGNILSETNKQYQEGTIDSKTRTSVQRIARQKRIRLIKEAKTGRLGIINESKEERLNNIDAAREERDRTVDEAKQERDALK